jgi:membrane fusion protein (multidrug efflux system)
VTPEKKAKQTPVKTGLRDGGLIEVTGLPANAKVIGDGVIKVSDGMAVRLSGEKPRPQRTASVD